MSRWNGILAPVMRFLVGDPVRSRPAAEVPHYSLGYDMKGRRVYAADPGRIGYGSNDSMRNVAGSRPQSVSPDAHARYEMEEVAAWSASLDRDNGIYQGTISRIISFILGDGWTFQSLTDGETAQEQVEALHKEWAKRPEVRNLDDEFQFQEKLIRHMLVDPFILLIKNEIYGQVQFVAPERVLNCTKDRNPTNKNRIVNGIEIDSIGRVVAFWVGEWDEYGLHVRNEKRIDARNCIYWANRRRFDQTAGEPIAQASFATFAQLRDVAECEAWAWQLLSRQGFVLSGEGAVPTANALSALQGNTAQGAPNKVTEMHLGAGNVFASEKGKLEAFKYDRPNANFTESQKMYMRIIGMQLGLSLEFMLLIWSDTNYSSGRASHASVRQNTKRFVCGLNFILGEIHAWNTERWVALGALPASVTDAHEYHVPPYLVLDPGKEAEANKTALETNQTSFGRLAREKGMTRAELFAERADDFKAAAEIVLAHNTANADYPEAQITIADVLGFGAGKQPVAPSQPVPPEPDDDDESPSDDTPPAPANPPTPDEDADAARRAA